MDGWVTIGTKLDTKQLERDLNNAKNRLQKFEKEATELTEKKAEYEASVKGYEKQQEYLDKLIAKTKEYKEAIRQADLELEKGLKEGTMLPSISGTGPEAKAYNMNRRNREKLMESMQKANEEIIITTDKIREQTNQYQKQKSKLEEINTQIQRNAQAQGLVKTEINEINTKLESSKGYDKMESALQNVGKSLKSTVKSAIKWGLALIGIRTALSLLTRSFGILSQYNDDLAQRMENIKLILAVALEPIIMRIVNLIETLLSYLNSLMITWFGIDLYARASELSTEKIAKNMAGASSSAKDIRKQLAGFDEMNILGDNVTTSGGGGTATQFKAPEGGELPQWIKDLIKYKDEILALLSGIGSFIGLFKLGIGGLKSLGIAGIISGVVLAIKKLLKYLKDPTWENYGGMLQGIGIALLGIGVISKNVYIIIAGVIVALVGTLAKYWEKIQKGVTKGLNWLFSKGESVRKHFGGIVGYIYDMVVIHLSTIWNTINSTMGYLRELFDGFIVFFKGVFTGNWKQAWEGIKYISVAETRFIVSQFKYILDDLKAGAINVFRTIGDIAKGIFGSSLNSIISFIESTINAFITGVNKISNVASKIGLKLPKMSKISLPRLATGAIINQPGRGVPVGGAIAGESSREGILPLTDRRAMQELGQEIGKWININATIPVNIGNRQIARIIEQITADREFAMNS